MKKLLLFDLDGTLLTTRGAGIRAMQRAGRKLFGDHFSLDGIVFAGSLDTHIYYEGAQQSGVADARLHLDVFRDTYHAELERELTDRVADVRVLPGVHELLAALRVHPRVAMGLVTGNYALTAPVKLRAANIDPQWFAFNGFGDEADHRPKLVPLAMGRYARHTGRSIDPGDVIVIGDTPRDVEAGKANGCVAFAVATGAYGVAELLDAGADVAVESFDDPCPLLDLL